MDITLQKIHLVEMETLLLLQTLVFCLMKLLLYGLLLSGKN